jgi:DNA-binding NarL/FixJ family response regulator
LTLQLYIPADIVVLLVEADTQDAVMASRALQLLGLDNCYLVTSGEAALAWLEENGCDILLFENTLPRMSGSQLLQRVRAAAPTTQAIAMSKSRDAQVAINLIKLGAADYVIKDDYFTSNLARAVQAAARSKGAVDDKIDQEALNSGGSKLEAANAEAAWLLKMFRSRYGYYIPTPGERDDDSGWSEIVEVFRDYLETALRLFPDIVSRTEDTLVRMLIERGASPRDVILLYQMGVIAAKNSGIAGSSVRVHPGAILSRLLIRLVEEYQREISIAWEGRAA